MTSNCLNANDVAEFLVKNPDFFQQHATLFSELRVPHPHEKRAISLGERQILTLRSQNKELSQQLRLLVGHAKSNQKIGEQLHQWSCRMLAEPHAEQLPGHIIRSLTEIFDVDSITMRSWQFIDLGHNDISVKDIHFIKSLTQPYCGPITSPDIAAWLSEPAQSMAIVPLFLASAEDCIGALVMGSQDSQRFTIDMETDFLVRIGELCAAALSRLPLTPHLQA